MTQLATLEGETDELGRSFLRRQAARARRGAMAAMNPKVLAAFAAGGPAAAGAVAAGLATQAAMAGENADSTATNYVQLDNVRNEIPGGLWEKRVAAHEKGNPNFDPWEGQEMHYQKPSIPWDAPSTYKKPDNPWAMEGETKMHEDFSSSLGAALRETACSEVPVYHKKAKKAVKHRAKKHLVVKGKSPVTGKPVVALVSSAPNDIQSINSIPTGPQGINFQPTKTVVQPATNTTSIATHTDENGNVLKEILPWAAPVAAALIAGAILRSNEDGREHYADEREGSRYPRGGRGMQYGGSGPSSQGRMQYMPAPAQSRFGGPMMGDEILPSAVASLKAYDGPIEDTQTKAGVILGLLAGGALLLWGTKSNKRSAKRH